MKLNVISGVVAVLAFAALIVGYSSLFTVYQTQQALVIRLGQPVRVVNEPGLNVKAPLIDRSSISTSVFSIWRSHRRK